MTSDIDQHNRPVLESAPEELSPEIVEAAQKQLLTVSGRRSAASELTSIMLATGIDADQVAKPMEGSTGRNSPKKHAAAHTSRFVLETTLRRDIDALRRLIEFPFLFQDRVFNSADALDKPWFSMIAADGPAMMKPEPYKTVYQVVANIDEFRELDASEAARLDGIELVNDDFVVGIIVASGNVAQAVNYLLRWNNGAIKIVGIWS